ncbi:MAG: HK97 family phage prohead protease [Bacteroidales bacterium]|nr:HK97 family phage prohead protease [Bacteroidales bacterium]
MKISGYIPFSKESHYYHDNQGSYRVILDPHCLDCADMDHVECIISHCDKRESLLGSYPGDVRILIRKEGIYYEAKTIDGYMQEKFNRLFESDIRNKRMRGSSLQYDYVPRLQEWTKDEQGSRVLIIKNILQLIDVGPCIDPAYPGSLVWIGEITNSKIHEVELKYYEPVNEYNNVIYV